MDWQVEPLLWDSSSSGPRSPDMLILTEGLMHHRLSPSPIFGVSNLSEGLCNGG